MQSNHKENGKLQIDYLPVSSLTPDPKNPRDHGDRQIRMLVNSIKAVGFNVPLIVDHDGKVICGHARLQAAKLLGMHEVPTICLEHLTDTQVRAFMIADNRLTETASWNDKLLAEHLKILADMELDFSIEATGFTMGEIDLRIEGQDSDKDDPADMPVPVTKGPPVTQPGDLWLLGRHRLYCGNALEAESYRVLMEDKRAAIVFTDPPYNVKVDGHVGGLGAIKHREFAMASGEMSNAEFTSFLTRACSLMARYSTDGSIHYICMDWRHMGELLEAGELAYTELKALCVWAKDNGGMGSFYRSQHELVFVFKNGRAPHRNNVQLGQYGRYRSNLWSYAGANSFSARKTEEGNLLELHPTCKPLSLVADTLLDASARGDIALDPFLGSGTTILAAERTGRIAYGMEIDALYADTIIHRWQIYTGEQAIHAISGRTFSDIAAEKETDHVG